MEESVKSFKKLRIEEFLIFTDDDAQAVQFPHNDAIVVTLNIKNYDVRCILIDNRNSTDVLFYDAFFQMDIPQERLWRLKFFLMEFTADAVLVEGVITLPVVARQSL